MNAPLRPVQNTALFFANRAERASRRISPSSSALKPANSGRWATSEGSTVAMFPKWVRRFSINLDSDCGPRSSGKFALAQYRPGRWLPKWR